MENRGNGENVKGKEGKLIKCYWGQQCLKPVRTLRIILKDAPQNRFC